uniref:GED domain-containing protein n=1 Tax=Cryptomonas curvata TaxID=233186 RepID=A0A7S0MMN7_9CRYP
MGSFGGFGDALRRTSMLPPSKVTRLSERERLEANVLRQLLEHYFRIVRATVLDAVPKAIMLMMVNTIQENLQERLMQKIYLSEDDEAFGGLTRESEEVRRRRTEVKEQVACLRKAISVMREM